MAGVSRVGDSMSGNVGHHANHITGYDSNNNPIYCTGHSVSGKQTSGVSKFKVGGQPVATIGKSGSSNCACDGKGYTNTGGKSKFKVGGQPVSRIGDGVNLHEHGSGTMTSGFNKFNVR